MSKELEALNKIQHDFGQLKGQELVKCYETIFNGLKRLEAIDKLEQELGCPLEVVLNLIKNSNQLDKSFHTQDIYFEYDGQLLDGSFLRLGFENGKYIFYVHTSLPDSEYDCETIELSVKDYKKTWWLKEDKSE